MPVCLENRQTGMEAGRLVAGVPAGLGMAGG